MLTRAKKHIPIQPPMRFRETKGAEKLTKVYKPTGRPKGRPPKKSLLGKRQAPSNPEELQFNNDSLESKKFVMVGQTDPHLAEEQELKQLVQNVAKKLTYDDGAD